jgi:hypothetical protein
VTYSILRTDSQERFPAVRIDNGFKSEAGAAWFLERFSTGYETSVETVLTSDIKRTLDDRTLRDIWKHDTSASLAKIGVDMADAKALVLSRVRAIRDASLLELDTEYAIASRTGADTSGLDTQRQTLLDATEALKALDVDDNGIVTPEEAMAALAV